MRRGDHRVESRVPKTEKRISEIESGKIRMPVCERVEAERHLQVDRHHEEEAGDDRVLRAQDAQPAAQLTDREQVDVHEGLAALRDELTLTREEQHEQHDADHDEPCGERDAERSDLDAVELGGVQRHDPAPGLALQHPEHDADEAERRQDHAQQVDADALALASSRRSGGRRCTTKIMMTTSATKTYRQLK